VKKLFKAVSNSFFALLVVALVVSIAPLTVQANQDIRVTVDGAQVTFEAAQKPVIVDGRTLVPAHGVFEKLGFYPTWDSHARTTTLTRNGYDIKIHIDSNVFTLNGAEHTLDVNAQIMNGYAMLPLRAVLESVGYRLYWDSATRTVNISTGPGAPPPAAEPQPVTETETETEAETETPTASGTNDILDVLGFYSDLLEMQIVVSNALSFSTDLSNLMERLDALTEITNLISATDYQSIDSMRVKANGLAGIAARFGVDIDAFRHLL